MSRRPDEQQPLIPAPIAAQVKKGLIRTVVPYAVAAILTGAIKLGIELDQAWLEDFVTGAVLVVYYLTIRLLEELRDSRFGVFLGSVGRPNYAKPGK
jgi:hypothetical protein